MKSKLIYISIFIAFIYLLFNIVILPHYGISWDAPGHYPKGQAYVQYYLTGNGDSFDTNEKRLSIYQKFRLSNKIGNFTYLLIDDIGHPSLNDILASLSNRIFYQGLNILGDVESYHLFIVLVSVFLVFLVFLWTYQEYGIFAGIVALLSIALYPLFFGESHFNIKDPVEAFFYAATIYTFYKSITKSSWKWMIISSIFAGCALGTKFNIFFVVLTIIPWFLIYKWKSIKSFTFPLSKNLTIAILIYPLITFSIFYISWPYLWQSPINNILKIFTYYKEIGGTNYQPEQYLIFGKLINTFALQWILYTTPIVILFFSFFGIIYSIKFGFKEKNKTSLLILFWLLVPILRVLGGGAGIYGGVRQIMEYIPAMAILSGIGAKYIISILNSIFVKHIKVLKKSTIKPLFIVQVICILSFIPITLKLISIHPNENVYFNPLIGGLSGAREKNLMYWGNSFGNAYRQGVEWLNENAQQNSKVVLGVAYENSIPRIWLRKDLKFSNLFQSGMEKDGEYIVELTNDMPVWPHYYYYSYARNMLEPLYQVKVDGVSILTIWKNDKEHTKKGYKKKETELSVSNVKKGEGFIMVDLEKEVSLTQIQIDFNEANCLFVRDGYFITSDNKGNWINHPGDLEEVAFYENFNSGVENEYLSYLFPGDLTRYIKIVYSDKNDCLKNIKGVKIKKI